MRIEGDAPQCPGWLDDDAKAEWARVVPELSKQYIVTPVDMALLAAYCQTWSDYVRGVLLIREQGACYTSDSGLVRSHPEVKANAARLAELRRIATELGFSPGARSRIEVPPPSTPEIDAMEEFLNPAGPAAHYKKE
jgi:P27 family predicted phage terminase small subunit